MAILHLLKLSQLRRKTMLREEARKYSQLETLVIVTSPSTGLYYRYLLEIYGDCIIGEHAGCVLQPCTIFRIRQSRLIKHG